MQILDLNMEDGLTYCGTMEVLEEIVKQYAEKGFEPIYQLEELYQKENWNDYVVLVHSFKSGLKTIGANRLSEQCKKLEEYGKKANEMMKSGASASDVEVSDKLDEIREKHPVLVADFKQFVQDVREYFGMEPLQDTGKMAETTEKLILTPEIEEMIAEFENAAFDLDADKMLGMLVSLETTDQVAEVLKPIHEKIEEFDLFSAVEALKECFS